MTIAHILLALITAQPTQLPGLALQLVGVVHQQHKIARQLILNNTIHEIQQEQILLLHIEVNECLLKQQLESRKKPPHN